MKLRKRQLPIVVMVGLVAPAVGCGNGGKTQASAEPTTNASTSPGSSAKPVTVIKKPSDIPMELGGAVAPYPRPAPIPSSSGAPAQGAGAPRAVPPSPAAVAAAPESEVRIVHNHPPDQPCNHLDPSEVQKALDDLKKTN